MKFTLTKIVATAILSCSLIVSCSKQDETPQPSSDEGVVTVGLSTDSLLVDLDYASKAVTKAEPTLTVNDFAMQIENTRGEVLKTWASYADMEQPLQLKFGSYKLVASYGGSVDALPSFDGYVYGSESKFAVSQELPIVNLEMVCKPLFTKADVKFNEASFDYTYSSYSVAVKTFGDSLHFYKADQGRAGYFKPGKLRLMFELEAKDRPGQKEYFFYDTKITTKAAEYYKLKLNAINNSGDLSITITTVNETIDLIVEKELPNFWLPQPAPEVVSHSFGEQSKVETTRGLKADAWVIMKTYAGVKNLIVKTSSQEMISNGFPIEGVDIVGAAADNQGVQLLKNMGMTWNSKLNDPTTAIELKSNAQLGFDFETLSSMFDKELSHGFSMELVDKYDQKAAIEFVIDVKALQFDVTPIVEGNVWATFAEISGSINVNRPGFPMPKPQISTDGGTTWVTPTYEEVIAQDGINRVYVVKGLTPVNDYKFRVYVDENTIKGTSNVFRTETVPQVPNANMEEWNVNNYSGNLVRYYPWNNGGSSYWDTYNELTTWYTFKNAYTHASSVVYTADNAYSGKSAEIRNISAQLTSSPVNSTNVNEAKQRSAGKLFVGWYDTKNWVANYGRDFSARPVQMSFMYQYLPLDTDECRAWIQVWNITNGTRTNLGEGEFKLSTGTHMNGYEKATVEINYTVRNLRATHYTIEFKSSTADTPPVATNVGIDYPGAPNPNSNGHIGSKFRVDNIELHY